MMTQREDIVAQTEQRRFELNISLLRVYNYYRLGVGLALLGASAQGLSIPVSEACYPPSFSSSPWSTAP